MLQLMSFIIIILEFVTTEFATHSITTIIAIANMDPMGIGAVDLGVLIIITIMYTNLIQYYLRKRRYKNRLFYFDPI